MTITPLDARKAAQEIQATAALRLQVQAKDRARHQALLRDEARARALIAHHERKGGFDHLNAGGKLGHVQELLRKGVAEGRWS